MATYGCAAGWGSQLLALAVARVHRSETIEGLARAFLAFAPALVDADAFGVYLLDARRRVQALYSVRAAPAFLHAYERLRMEDPLFLELLEQPRFTHTRALVSEEDWRRHPLCRLMGHWQLRYSIAAPLVAGGRLAGTVNFARRDRGYYDAASLEHARFLCAEIAYAFARLMRDEQAARVPESAAALPPLPERTRQVLLLAAAGASNRRIAERLSISENTVRDHIKRGYGLLGVHNRIQLAVRLLGAAGGTVSAQAREASPIDDRMKAPLDGARSRAAAARTAPAERAAEAQ